MNQIKITDDLIVTDTSPLITLALADHLTALTAPNIRVVVPDAVWFEATRIEQAPGVSELIEWAAKYDHLVSIRPTETGLDQMQRFRDRRPIRGMGEAASLEVLEATARLHPDRHMLLIFEDKDLEKRSVILPEKAFAISTGDWLRTIERAGLIQSADMILDQAAAKGRTVDRLRVQVSAQEALEAAQTSVANARTGSRGR